MIFPLSNTFKQGARFGQRSEMLISGFKPTIKYVKVRINPTDNDLFLSEILDEVTHLESTGIRLRYYLVEHTEFFGPVEPPPGL